MATLTSSMVSLLYPDFENDKFRYLISAQAANVGLDVSNLQLCVKTSTTRSYSTHEQQVGRIGRKEGGKIGYVPNVIAKGTIAESKFRSAQKRSINIRHINNLSEIIYERKN